MRRWLPVLMALILVLAMTAACGDDSGDDDDDGAAPTATTATAAATMPAGAGAATATTGDDEGDDEGDDSEGDAAAGQTIAQAQCMTCHTIDGSTLVGPTWQGLYGHEVTLDDGSTVTADDEYIRESILDPNAKIVEGFPAAMPTFNGILDDEQINNIIAYIKTLE